MAKDDKLKALDAAIAQIERQYGKGSVMKLGDNSANMNVETVPTEIGRASCRERV